MHSQPHLQGNTQTSALRCSQLLLLFASSKYIRLLCKHDENVTSRCSDSPMPSGRCDCLYAQRPHSFQRSKSERSFQMRHAAHVSPPQGSMLCSPGDAFSQSVSVASGPAQQTIPGFLFKTTSPQFLASSTSAPEAPGSDYKAQDSKGRALGLQPLETVVARPSASA